MRQKLANNWGLILIATLVALAAGKLLLNFYLGDVDFESDSYMHFLQAKTVFANLPSSLEIGVSVWAKPLYTYAHGVWLGLFSEPRLIHAQFLNIVLSLFAALITYKTLRALKLKASLAYFGAVMSNIGFLTLRASISTLTEPIFTLVFMLAVYFWVKDKPWLSAALIGISVLGRLEAVLFVGLWWLFYVARQEKVKARLGSIISYGLVLILPTFIWNFIGFLISGKPLFLISQGYPSQAGVYGYGLPLTYVEGLFVQEGIVTTLIVLSLAVWLNNRRKSGIKLDLKSNWTFITLILLVFTVVQSFLYTFGLFGTAGLMRYFVIVMPLFAMLASWGLAELELKFTFQELATAVLVIMLVAAQALTAVNILRYGGYFKGLDNRPNINPEMRTIWLELGPAEELKSARILYANKPELIYYAGRSLQNSTFTLDFSNLLPGSLVVLEKDWLTGLNVQKLDFFTPVNGFEPITLPSTYSDIYLFRYL